MLCRPDSEARVSNTGLPRVLLRRRNTLDIRIEPFNARGESRHAECEAAIATSEVQDALPAHEPLATHSRSSSTGRGRSAEQCAGTCLPRSPSRLAVPVLTFRA